MTRPVLLNLARATDLTLSQPRFRAKTGVSHGRQRLSQIESVFLTECGFVESFPDWVEGNLTRSHAGPTYTAREPRGEVRKPS